MCQGYLVSIHISATQSGLMETVPEIQAIPGKGLCGDRYFYNGSNEQTSRPSEMGDDITLIEIEAIEALERDKNILLLPGDARRNLVTRNIPLNHLVGKRFLVGQVLMRGVRLCEPCSHLEQLTQAGVRHGLIHRGGLRADILTEGIIHTGDLICLTDTT